MTSQACSVTPSCASKQSKKWEGLTDNQAVSYAWICVIATKTNTYSGGNIPPSSFTSSCNPLSVKSDKSLSESNAYPPTHPLSAELFAYTHTYFDTCESVQCYNIHNRYSAGATLKSGYRSRERLVKGVGSYSRFENSGVISNYFFEGWMFGEGRVITTVEISNLF